MVIEDRKSALSVPSVHSIAGRLRLRQLSLAMAIEELGSLRKAADRIGLSQPAATKMLLELEHTLGVPLFVRGRRGMISTVYGNAMLRYAHLIVSDIGNMREELAGLASGTAGKLSVGTITAAAAGPLAAAISTLKQRRPMLEVSVIVDTSDNLLPMLEQGRLDVFIGRVLDSTDSTNVDFAVIGEETLAVVVGALHPLAARTSVSLSELSDSAWILQPRSSPLRQLMETTFRDHGMDTPHNIVETASILTATTLLQEAQMVAVVPQSVALHYVASGLLCILPIGLKRQLDKYGVITLRRRIKPPALLDFMQLLATGTPSSP